MSPDYRIKPAREQDILLIPAIELSAARLLSGHAPESVLSENIAPEELLQALHRGHLWVALESDVPVGFAQLEELEPGVTHLKEIDVLPQHGRRGLGTRLVMAVCEWAAESGSASVTLTTFRDVPWNMPFYARLGFAEIPLQELSPALLAVLKSEAHRGLDPARRVAMRRWCMI
jgi:GNAT superfamily N-acetyltransferase